MLRPNIQTWRFSFITISSAIFTQKSRFLLDRVRLLSARGHLTEALTLFYANDNPHCPLTYAALFHQCARQRCIAEGLSLHRYMTHHNPTNPPDLFVSNHIINMYCKCGYLDYAHQLFDQMSHRNFVSWTVLISGYAQRGWARNCALLFSAMLGEFRPNEFAFASVLSSCGGEGGGWFGRQVHALALKMCLDVCTYVANSLVSMYSKISFRGYGGDGVVDAWAVFKSMECRSTVSWNSMIQVFKFHGRRDRAVGLFTEMHRKGVDVDRATLLSVFSSICVGDDNDVDVWFRFCVQLQCLAVKIGFSSEVKVATALIKAYSDLGGNGSDCFRVFKEASSHRDIILWTSIITAFSERESETALLLYSRLCEEDLAPDWHTLSVVLKACAGLVTERHALTVHSRVIKAGFEGDTIIANSLIHAYARCGSNDLSKQVFYEIEERDLISWNSMIKAYALHGQAREALELFSKIDRQPDSATFVALLSACAHAGLVEEGIKVFDCMQKNYGIVTQVDHYACMVDMYGRAGKIHEAEKLISQMPMKPDSVLWSTLLSSCRKHGKTQLAKLAVDKLKDLEPRSSLGYVQMSNIYSSSGKFKEAGVIWNEMKEYQVRKEPGLSWVEIGNRVHEFASGGHRRPDREIICSKLDELIRTLKEMGYVPETNLALQDIEEEQKEEQLYYHSEKLALAFALTSNDDRRVIKIIKNIRICVDCHKFMKLASDFLRKEIVVRDSNRFHHFKDGICSCNDYW